jgi:hypothetical protein
VILAVDIGGTKFAAGLVTLRGELLDRTFVPVEHDVGPQSHFAALVGIVRQQLEQVEEHHGIVVTAIGIGCSGPIERQCATVSPVSIPAWRAFPLRQHLSEMFELPVYGDLDAKALALAEGWLGAAQGLSTFCALTVSTGIGGGIVIDGELLGGRRPSRRTRSCAVRAGSSDAHPRRSATGSTSTWSWSAAVWRSGSRRRSSTPPRRSSTATPSSGAVCGRGSHRSGSAIRVRSSGPEPWRSEGSAGALEDVSASAQLGRLRR